MSKFFRATIFISVLVFLSHDFECLLGSEVTVRIFLHLILVKFGMSIEID